MKKKVLAAVLLGLTLIFAVELSVERIFQKQRIQQTMAETENEGTEQASEQEKTEPQEKPAVYVIFGIDQDEGDDGRSDCVLLCALSDDGVVRLCSLARDTLVTLPETGKQTKLGHAYAKGGPELAMKTIQQNFGIEVDGYASINFTQMAKIVDLMGGVELQLTQKEWNYLGLKQPYLGRIKLDGQQALRYSRIRSIDSDEKRTARQRQVVSALLKNLSNVPRAQLPELILDGVKMCRTNVSLMTMMNLGKQVLSLRDGIETISLSLPGDSVTAWGGKRSDGIWYYVYDLKEASRVVGEFFYGSSAEEVIG